MRPPKSVQLTRNTEYKLSQQEQSVRTLADANREVESPIKRMLEKGKGKRRTQTKCRANKRRRFAALSTREAEETKADHRNNLQHTEAARMLPALGFCFHTRFRHKFRFGFGTNCWAALRRGWRLCGTAWLCLSRAACCATTGGNPWSGGRVNGGMDTTVG